MLEGETPATLEKLSGEAPDSDTERMIATYRRQRIAELKKEEKRARFGEIIPIGRDDYSREVTEASKVDEPLADEEGEGTGVVCFLYKDGDPACVKLASQLRILSKRHPRTKFVSIVGNKCIPDYPDRLQPTLIMYRKGEVTAQVVSWGKDRERSFEELEALLIASYVVKLDGRPLASTSKTTNERRSDDEFDDDLDDRSATKHRSGLQSFQPHSKTTSKSKNIRGPRVEDDDSDFDL
ncbi:hypothetical protein FRC02_001738 [Tulasnella sp. 418]|nr:hypothetical protein FRC02_001738 [Tulasnella sp. 418]